jgi:DNA-binding PadR family transcriptional regulator
LIRHALLALLREHPDHGYQLKRRFDDRVGRAWQLNIGQVYQTLQALAHAGLVRELPPPDQGRSSGRRVFEITPKGLRTLERWLRRPGMRLRPVRDELLLRLLCVEPGQFGSVLADVDVQERASRCRLAELRVHRARLARMPAASPVSGLALAAEILQLTMRIEWLGHCRTVLADWPTETPGALAGAHRENGYPEEPVVPPENNQKGGA